MLRSPDSYPLQVWSQSESRSVSRPVCLGVRHPSGTRDQLISFLRSLLDSCRFVCVGRPLWRKDGSVICSAMTQVQCQVILSWCPAPIWDPRPVFFLISLIIFRQLRVFYVRRPLWREVSFFWASLAQSLSGQFVQIIFKNSVHI
jgi:hypothetical protein